MKRAAAHGSLAQRLYRRLSGAAGPILRWLLARRAAQGREDPKRLPERQGHASMPRPPGPLVWLHAASVGEALSLLPLIAALRTREPALAVLLTTGTRSSGELLPGRLPPGAFHQYIPLDHPAWADRFLDHWRPNLALFVESEIWPNLLGGAQARGVPTGLLNARVSARSLARWQRLPSLIRPLMANLALCLAQNAAQAARMTALGAPNARTLGNLKLTAPPDPPAPGALAALRLALGTRPRWLAASTHPGEEAIAADLHTALSPHHPGLITLLAPRHPERAEAILDDLHGRGLRVARHGHGDPLTAETDVFLLDTLGELSLLYSVTDIAFVGGSLRAHGGHNPVEPAHHGCAVLHGPDMSNFSELAEDLRAAGGDGAVATPAELRAAVDRLLRDPAACEAQARAARTMADRQAGLLDAVLVELEPLLAPLRPARAAA